MTIINPWSLERLLQVAHPTDAISGTIEARNDKYDIKLETSRRAEQGDFTYLFAEIKMNRARENMFTAEQVRQLTSLYGGDKSLQIALDIQLNPHPHRFFISIDDGKISSDENVITLRMPPGEFSPRPLLRDICRILHLRYEETEPGIYLPKEQQPLITPETVRDTYHRMKRSEYFPSLSCSSPRAGFSVYQHPAPEGIHQTISIHQGSQFSEENPLTAAEISRMEKNLLEYCPTLPQLDYTWRTEKAKDMERWADEGMGP